MHLGRKLPSAALIALAVVLLLIPHPASAHGPTHQPDPSSEDGGGVWGCPMCETVRQDVPGECPLCGMDLVRIDRLLNTEAVTGAPAAPPETGKAGEAQPLMPGVPGWLFYAASLSTLVVSFVLFEVWGRRRLRAGSRGRRFSLFRIPGIERLIKQPWLQLSLQFPVTLLFLFVVGAGLFGNPAPEKNIAPALTWTIWWTWLAFLILFLGKLWCTACPWMGIADGIAKLGLWGPSRRPFGLNKRWPKSLRNIWLATFFFVFLTWLELGYGVTQKPWLTASLALFMVAASLSTVLVFERKAFCQYACLVGRVSGLYAMFASTELRAADPEVCRNCRSRDCYHGNERGDPCPTNQYLGSMDANTYCTLCMECVKTCPEDNVSWNARPWGADLMESSRTRVDEAYLAVIMLSMSAFHGFSMTPVWEQLIASIQGFTGGNWLFSFTLGMTGMILLPLAIYYGICFLMKELAGDAQHSTRTLFIKFSYSLLPIALFYHLAHNLQHVFFEGMKLVRIASDPFGRGWDLFGTADMAVRAVLPLQVGWGLQVALILIGHIFGILIAHKAAFALYDQPRQATLSQVPILAAMLLFSFQSLWLIAQPMVMRTAM